ncbi:MAG: homocysteine S-methyltransferase family protein [Ilumatobacteraceae bacterium]
MPYIGDGGIETSLIFLQGIDLPDFAAFPLLDTDDGRAALTTYYEPYFEIAERFGVGFVVDTPTWRASLDWGSRLGYDPDSLVGINRRGRVRRRPGSRSNGPGRRQRGHRPSWRRIRGDLGHDRRRGSVVPRAAGASLGGRRRRPGHGGDDDLLERGDRRGACGRCHRCAGGDLVHHRDRWSSPVRRGPRCSDRVRRRRHRRCRRVLQRQLRASDPLRRCSPRGESWTSRVKGVRVNASTSSHAELDEAEELDRGDIAALARHCADLRELHDLRLVGGCCGTDTEHLDAIAATIAPS